MLRCPRRFGVPMFLMLAACGGGGQSPSGSSSDSGAGSSGDSSLPSRDGGQPSGDASAQCGNGKIDPGETCDPPSSCPTSCQSNGCSVEKLVGSAAACNAQCQATVITACVNNDGCCPTGCTPSADSDCSKSCGNGICDGTDNCTNCPGDCPVGTGQICCSESIYTGNCCVNSDCTGGQACQYYKCQTVCGNGRLDTGETCDPTDPQAPCPTSCDGGTCSTGTLANAGTCTASCTYTPVTACVSGDGCCGVGCTQANDSDCPAPGTAGWLHTSGGQILDADGGVWMGRGVNMDDILFCAYDYDLANGPADVTEAKAVVDELVNNWKVNFIRISMYMGSYSQTYSWINNTKNYATLMTEVVNYIGQYPGVYVLLTLRSDPTMNCPTAPAENNCLPTEATVPVYKALLDSFSNSSFVMFGVSNEPDDQAVASLPATMSIGVQAIRDEETKLGTPQHLIAVQGSNSPPLQDYTPTAVQPSANVIYEIHYYPQWSGTPQTDYLPYVGVYPFFFGEYGGPTGSESDTMSASFFKDCEDDHIPSLAWDFSPFVDCAPDLLTHTGSLTNNTAWGNSVKAYTTNPSSYK